MADIVDCFVCGESLANEGVQLSSVHTPYSKTELPTMISQLMGNEFMVVFSMDDMICTRCSALLNHCDKLETDLHRVQKALTGYLNKKYKLFDALYNPKTQQNDNEENITVTDQARNLSPTSNDPLESDNVTITEANETLQISMKSDKQYFHHCKSCAFKTTSQSSLDEHVKQCQKYKCSICDDEVFKNEKQLRRHTMSAHLTNWLCHFCGSSFSDQVEYTSHMKVHLSSSSYNPPQPQTQLNVHKNSLGQYECNLCDFKSPFKRNFHEHVRTHAPKVLKCRKCYAKFTNEDEFRSHVTSHGLFPCDFCFSVFKKQILLNDHITKNHQDSETLSLVESLQPEKLYLEEVGDENIVTLNDSLTGVTLFANSLKSAIQHQCQFCSLSFLSRTVLHQHLETHRRLENLEVPSENETTVISDFENDNNLDGLFDKSRFSTVLSNIDHLFQPITNTNTIPNDISWNVLEIGDQQETLDQIHKDVFNIDTSNTTLSDILEMVRTKKLSSIDPSNFLNIELNSAKTGIVPLSGPNERLIVEPDLPDMSEIKGFVCAICAYQTLDQTDLKRHFKEHKDNKSYMCSICNRQLSSYQKLNSHIKSHQRSPGTVECLHCTESFSDNFHLQQHIQEQHHREKLQHKCQFCEERFNTKKAMKCHEETHPERYSLPCPSCDQLFLREKQLKDHIELEHRDPHCRFCGKEILKPKTLRFHEMRHSKAEESYNCPECQRVFKTKTGLRHHAAVHTGNYTYCCSYCGRGFMSRMMMEEHMSKHTKENRYVCDICGKKFVFQSTYWIHRKWHDVPFPYKCADCGRLFRHSSLLAVHKRKHTGERPYKCPHCPLAFPVSGTLKRHLILHTGVYPFNCEDCKRGFTTKHKYASHRAKLHNDHDLAPFKQPGEFIMAVRDTVDDSSVGVELLDWEGDEQEGFIFQLTNGDDCGEIIMHEPDDLVPCTVITDNVLVDGLGNPQMVQIVLDDTSQPITSAEEESVSMLTDLWSYQ